MKFRLAILLTFFCIYQLVSTNTKEDEVNTYIQSVQEFWTDERLAQAKPKPMSIDSIDSIRNNGNHIGGFFSFIIIFFVFFLLIK